MIEMSGEGQGLTTEALISRNSISHPPRIARNLGGICLGLPKLVQSPGARPRQGACYPTAGHSQAHSFCVASGGPRLLLPERWLFWVLPPSVTFSETWCPFLKNGARPPNPSILRVGQLVQTPEQPRLIPGTRLPFPRVLPGVGGGS